MCDIQSSVIHSSTAGGLPAHHQELPSPACRRLPPQHQELTPGALWDLASSELAWGAMPNYQAHPLWEAAASHHPAQYQPDIFGFGPDFWGGGSGKGGVPAHLVPGSRSERTTKAVIGNGKSQRVVHANLDMGQTYLTGYSTWICCCCFLRGSNPIIYFQQPP
jgi:hypothetical protein